MIDEIRRNKYIKKMQVKGIKTDVVASVDIRKLQYAGNDVDVFGRAVRR